MRVTHPGSAVVLAAAAVAAGCDDGPPPTSREALESAAYVIEDGATVTLSEGQATGAEGVRYDLVVTAEGDLDFDGELDAAAVVVESRRDARFVHLHALLGDGETTRDAAARLIGDRLGVKRVKIEDGVIRMDLLTREPGEPVTISPTVDTSRDFVLTDRGLTPIFETRVGDMEASVRSMDAADDAEGGEPADGADDYGPAIFTHEWTLTSLTMGDGAADLAALDEPIVVQFMAELSDVTAASGQLSGHAGCNRMFGSFRAEESGVLLIAGLATTRRMCEGPISDLEQRFLEAFDAAESFEIEGDRLTLASPGGSLEFRASGRLLPPEPEPSSFEEADDAPEGEKDGRRRT